MTRCSRTKGDNRRAHGDPPGDTDRTLADHVGLIPTIAEWNSECWKKPLKRCVEFAERCADSNPIPDLYVALLEGKPVGEVTLIAYDMDIHTDLTPWLSALLVLPSYRRRGIGSELVTHLEDQAKEIGFLRLYLFTSAAESLYARLGWVAFTRERYEGEDVALMSKDL